MSEPSPVRQVRVIGIGAGSPEFLTQQAVAALNEVDVFLVADKGDTADQLLAVRRGICERFVRPDRRYRVIGVADPDRGPDARRGTDAYEHAVRDWHAARAAAYVDVVRALPADAVVGFLVWGDPAFYDSTLRIVATMARTIPLQVQVVPGITAFQALAAAHQMVLHGIGEPVHVTTGRRLVREWRPDLGPVVVMLDGRLACRDLVPVAPDLTLHWGAYLGLPQQQLRSGRLADVVDDVVALRSRLRREHGWVMDVYSLTST